MVISLVVLNGLLGALCGLWFRVKILIPLTALVIVEVVVFKSVATWSSTVWLTIGLIFTIEMSYLIGSALAALSVSPIRREALHDLRGASAADWPSR